VPHLQALCFGVASCARGVRYCIGAKKGSLTSITARCSKVVLNITSTIEVAPGEFLPLRGAAQCDFYVPYNCAICNNIMIFCIEDADFVLCPLCRVMSPVEDADSCMPEGQKGEEGGVGLGFPLDELAKWQDEISQARLHESTWW